ncbi:hypothetical protein CP533_6027 [Ophiocordyceps camponoti-saundersi (nom. inval.)]|nr:hypothetical protein CP533_6027 [Ophiocordyceps camponoti-saundersi (nom. inval.)]
MPSSTIKFDVPDGCRAFTLFPRLPIEMRHRVWECFLASEQGANFVKFNVSDEGHESTLKPDRIPSSNDADDTNPPGGFLTQHDNAPRNAVPCLLVTPYPEPKAEVSNHALLRRRLAIMAATCSESRSLVASLLKRSGVLRLESGTVVSIDCSLDLLVLDYYPHDLYKVDDTLDVDLECPSLNMVRRLAVRFCHFWKPQTSLERMCSCGKHLEIDTGNYPVHLYQFLARSLPNLREFYLIDYYIVPKAPLDLADTRSRTSHAFRARDRNLHDVTDCDPSTGPWKIEPKSRKILDWLRDRFVRYASVSRTSRHEAPEKVYFGLLACEWKIMRPIPREDQLRFRIPYGRGRVPLSARHSDARTLRPTMRHYSTGSPSHPTNGQSAAAADRGLSEEAERPRTQAALGLSSSVFVFGSGCGDGYKFTFSQPVGLSV